MLKSARLSTDHTLTEIFEAIGQGGKIQETETGIYVCPHFNFHNEISNKKEEYFTFGDYEMGAYGVCDTIEQVKEQYSKWLNDPEKDFCISFTKVEKSEQSSWGGWRWHKWGEYIGVKTPQCEYLYDEGEDIQEVYCYHIFQLLD